MFKYLLYLIIYMHIRITGYDHDRALYIGDNEKINISDNSIIQYTGIYYKKIDEIVDIVTIETIFVGKIETSRGNYINGTTGIYVEPLFIWDFINSEWLKISNYKKPTNKYFLYPHLLLLPNEHYHYKPLYFLHTCQNIDIENFKDINKIFNL